MTFCRYRNPFLRLRAILVLIAVVSCAFPQEFGVAISAFNGSVSTIGGTGDQGCQGMGGLAKSAQINKPQGLALDRLGNLFVMSQASGSCPDRILRIAPGPDGIVNGGPGESVKAVAGGGSLWSNKGRANGNQINAQGGLAFDVHGDLYMTSQTSVFKITSGLDRIIDGIEDAEIIFRLDAQSVVLPSDGGVGDLATIAADQFGNLFTGYSGNTSSYLIKIEAGPDQRIGTEDDGYKSIGRASSPEAKSNGSARSIGSARGIAFDRWGNLFTKVSANEVIRMEVGQTGEIVGDIAAEKLTAAAGTGKVGYAGHDDPALTARFNYNSGIGEYGGNGLLIDADGNALISDKRNHLLRRIVPSSDSSVDAAITGEEDELISNIAGTAPGTPYNICNTANPAALNAPCGTDPPGGFADAQDPLKAKFSHPGALAADICTTGHVYISDIQNNRVRMVEGAAAAGSPAARSFSRSVDEGDSGEAPMTFRVSLAYPCPYPVPVHVVTMNGTANANEDFAQISETIMFDPGQTTKFLDVPIIGDTNFEPDETFVLRLANITTGHQSEAVGKIINDDLPALPALNLPEVKIPDIAFSSNPPPQSSPPDFSGTAPPGNSGSTSLAQHIPPSPPSGTNAPASISASSPLPSTSSASSSSPASPHAHVSSGLNPENFQLASGLAHASTETPASAGFLSDADEATSPAPRFSMTGTELLPTHGAGPFLLLGIGMTLGTCVVRRRRDAEPLVRALHTQDRCEPAIARAY